MVSPSSTVSCHNGSDDLEFFEDVSALNDEDFLEEIGDVAPLDIGLQPSSSRHGHNKYLDYPYLSLEKEQELAKAYHSYQESLKNGAADESARQKALAAAHQLVMAHMRYVVKLSRQYINYGLPVNDLIQEGAVGLMKAVQNFNPFKGVRLVSFAVHWIKSEIHNYIVKNWRLVKVATTKAQRKLFFNFRKLKNNPDMADETSSQRNQRIARHLDVEVDEVEHMARRFADPEVALDAPMQEDAQKTFSEIVPSTNLPVEQEVIEDRQQLRMHNAVRAALNMLSARDKEIIQARFFSDDPMTLKELSEKLKISVERVRQLEKKSLQLLKETLNEFQEDAV